MRIHTNKVWRQALLPLLFVAALLLGSACVYADDNQEIWVNQRNSEYNNPVTDRPAMTGDDAFLKWGMKFGENVSGMSFDSMPNPPLIIGDYLYTQVNQYIYKVNKETGEIAGCSDALPAKSDWALHSMAYGGGRLFVTLSSGRVSGVDLDSAFDPSQTQDVWTSTRINGQQMNCPVTYRKIGGTGYVYTGSWGSEVADGSYYCFNADTGAPVWTFTPSVNDPKLAQSTAASKKRGFYWAGALVTDKYIAFGSDDGVSESTNAATATFYTLNPVTGRIISQIDGIYGDIRSTPVYYEGNIYIATKGGVLYQIPIDETGHLGNYTSFNFNQGASASAQRMITSSPTIVNDRLYIGVSSIGGSFTAKGHTLAVLDVSGKLSSKSLIYEVPAPGYPQASPLVSTSVPGASGDVCVYFTYNLPPGGIYYFIDAPGCTSPKEAGDLFLPEGNMRQYCTCTLAQDLDGTLYYKNDSTALMAIGRNPARIDNITVTTNQGEVDCEPETFRSGTANYTYKVESDVSKVSVKLDFASPVTATVNGKSCSAGGTVTVDFPEDQDQVDIEVVSSVASNHRTYLLKVTKQSGASTLSDNGLLIVNGNNKTPVNNSQLVSTVSAYDDETERYEVYSAFMTRLNSSSKLLNLWIQPPSEGSEVKVQPDENCQMKNMKDGSFNPSGSPSAGYSRYAIYPADTGKNCSVNVLVTSENKKSMSTYHVVFVLHINVSAISLEQQTLTLEPGSTADLNAVIEPVDATNQTKVFYSSDPTVAKVNWETGQVTAVSPGTCTITVVTEEGNFSAACEVTVPGDAVTDPAKLAGWVDDAIAELPKIAEIRPIHSAVIAAAASAYDKLPEEAKALVTKKDALDSSKSALEVVDYKEGKLSVLSAAVNLDLYYPAEQKAITQILQTTEEAIRNAATIESIDAAYSTAMTKIGKLSTKEQIDAKNASAKKTFQKTKIAGFTATMKNLKQVQTSWKAVKNATYYQLSWKLNESGSWKTVEIESEEGTKRLISGLSEGTCVKVRVRAARIIASEDVFSEWSTPVKVLMHKGTLKKLTKKSRGFNVVWKPLKNATGYQIQYSLKKTFKTKKTKTKNGAKSKKFKVRKLKKKKVYYVRTRAYRKVKGQVYYGSWSAVKKVKTKK